MENIIYYILKAKNKMNSETVNEVIEEIKTTRRPRGSVKNMTPEEKQAYNKIYNDKRGPRNRIMKTCEICEFTCLSGNFNRHCKSKKHIDNITKRAEGYVLESDGTI